MSDQIIPEESTFTRECQSYLSHKDLTIFIFNICVVLLVWMARKLGTTYAASTSGSSV